MANFTLTTGNDTVVAPAGATVYANAATLNPGDSLTGSGTDVLELIGAGSFNLSSLTNFSGFDKVALQNAGLQFAQLTLNGQPVEVDFTGYGQISVLSASNWNGSDIINGDPSSVTVLSFNSPNYGSQFTYDLTSNALTNISTVGVGSYVTLKINSSDAAGVQAFSGGGPNALLTTPDAILDLTHTKVAGAFVTSSNTLGTTFLVGDLGTAFQVQGGPGNDTLKAQGFTFTADQRNAIFETSSIETIIDQSGTYLARPIAINLTAGNDTIVTPSSGATVYATAATLNPGDSLTGGAGIDVLELSGSGFFNIDQLASFTGFESIKLDSGTTNGSSAYLTLGSQPIEVDSTGYVEININSPSNWNGSDIINGDSSPPSSSHTPWTVLWFSNPGAPSTPVNYDLTSNTFSHASVYAASNNMSFTINNSALAGIEGFYGYGLVDDKLVTAESTPGHSPSDRWRPRAGHSRCAGL
jgi:hypothetical protein